MPVAELSRAPSGRAAIAQNSDAIALGFIGDEWNLAIVRLAMAGTRRYKDFREGLGIANSVLSARPRPVAGPADHLIVGGGLGDRAHRAAARQVPHPVRRRVLAGTALPGLRPAGGVHDVRGTFGPSGSFARSVPRATTRRRSAGGSPGPGLVAQTIELIGNRRSAAALAAAFLGARRFTDLLMMTGAPPAIVADRLRTFCQLGVLSAGAGAGRAEYRLTDKGRAFFPHIMVMLSWGDRWFRAAEGPAMSSPTRAAARTSGRCCSARPAGTSCTARRFRSAARRPGRWRGGLTVPAHTAAAARGP